jgi:hypothetical protein
MDNSSDKPQLPIADENLLSGALQVLREETPALRDLLGLNLKRSVFTVDLRLPIEYWQNSLPQKRLADRGNVSRENYCTNYF